eukprot:CAMPEP_0170486724 /NCGR_PEP_ID=MMETSP0208-20121228/5667_1 /TAXON_ID=197538 /ORGANISM="Strombidium inclinatum, Strain S3" /LENGTH=43 /DNA_ID= /DNA_START= /DNA_END= /DNA_ORIENTATION=
MANGEIYGNPEDSAKKWTAKKDDAGLDYHDEKDSEDEEMEAIM